MKMINQDTICAIATAQGGAIGIIRVSGPKAIEITSRIFTPATGKPLTERYKKLRQLLLLQKK